MNDFPKTEEEVLKETIGAETLEGESKKGESPEEKVAHLTDAANADLMVENFGDTLRFDHKRKRWLIWGDHRWKPDDDEAIKRLAIKSARKRYTEAVNVDFKEREKVSKWAIQSENRQKIDATIALTRAAIPITDNGDDWDSDNFLLSCPNGILDLKTGKLRKGKPEDRITMSTNTEYKPDAKCPRWELFIDEIFKGDKEIIEYVHKALGYSITGDQSEQAAFFCYGSGANGKSVMFRTIRDILGDYGHDSPASLLQRHYSGNTNDVAATECKRFLVSSETLSTSKLNEQRIKRWTGGENESARYLYGEFFSFRPTCKIWLFVNHKPNVEDNSMGFWRRIRLIPFNVKFEGSSDDKKLPEKLMLEAEGILAWLVRGCLKWQKEGLEPTPPAVIQATQAYQAESDALYDFLADVYGDKVEEKVYAKDFYKTYVGWSDEQGFKSKDILDHMKFSQQMEEKFHKDRDMSGIYYENVRLPAKKNKKKSQKGNSPTYFEPTCKTKGSNSKTSYTRATKGSLRKTTPSPTYVPKKKIVLHTLKKLSRLTLSQLNKKKDFTEKWLKENEKDTKYQGVLKHYEEIIEAISKK